MEKLKQFICIIICFLTLSISSCDNADVVVDNNKYITFTAEENDFTYETTDTILEFSVSDDGTLYYVIFKTEPFTITFFAADINGNVIKEIDMTNLGCQSMTVYNDTLYYITHYGSNAENSPRLCSLNLSSGESTDLYTLSGYLEIKNMKVINNTLYFMGINKASIAKEYDLYNLSDDYFYYGEIFGKIDFETGVISNINDDFPINFSETVDKNLMIYAYDVNGGYYFQKYFIESDSFGEKIYKNIKMLKNLDSYFVTTENDEQIIRKFYDAIYISGLTNEADSKILNNAIELSPGQSLIYKSGYLFYKTNKSGIRRILLNKFFRSPTTLNMGYTDKGGDFPESYGFFINNKELSYNDIALSVLAGDSDIDFYLLNSRHDFADNIRKKGAYYPLNDVSGAEKYIDAAFPYIEEAAINKDKDIWMIPVNLYTLAVEYNKNVWDRYDLDIKSMSNLNEVIDTLYYFNDNKIDESYWLNTYTIIEKYFYQLIEKNKGFNKQEFKKMAEYSYNKLNFVKHNIKDTVFGVLLNETTKNDADSCIGGFFNAFIIDDVFYYGGKYGTSDFDANSVIKDIDYDDYEKAKSLIGRNSFTINNYINLRRTSLPSIEGFDKNDMTCEFFYVNPNSKNLDLVLEYISEYCKETMNKRNSFILKDKSTYDDRVYINDFYDIYNSDSYVRFGLSEELFFEDFEKYLGDEITLDEYLNRIEYKINAYLNE